MKNIFYRLFKYKPDNDSSSSENFVTESFVSILEYSRINKTDFLSVFIDFLGYKIGVKDYSDIFIDTQRHFETCYGIYAIPDITIQVNNLYIFIEVKYDSGINNYQLPQNPVMIINQVEKYQGINLSTKSNKVLYNLVVTHSNIDFKKDNLDFNREILWHEVYSLLIRYKSNDSIEAYLHNHYKQFMEDIKMAIPKVSYELPSGMQSLLNLMEQIEIALNDLQIPYARSFGSNWTGYYFHIDKKLNDKSGFIGTYWEPNRLTFTFAAQKVQNTIISQNIEDQFGRQPDNKTFCRFFYFEEEHFYCLKPQEQVDRLKNWIKPNYDLLLSLAM